MVLGFSGVQGFLKVNAIVKRGMEFFLQVCRLFRI